MRRDENDAGEGRCCSARDERDSISGVRVGGERTAKARGSRMPTGMHAGRLGGRKQAIGPQTLRAVQCSAVQCRQESSDGGEEELEPSFWRKQLKAWQSKRHG